MDNLDDLASAARERERGRQQPRPTSIPYAERAKPAIGFIRRYRLACGGRSFIFQSILLGWTGFMFFLFMATSFGAVARGGSQEEQTSAVGTGMCCMFGGWLLLAIPLLFAAVGTYRPDKP